MENENVEIKVLEENNKSYKYEFQLRIESIEKRLKIYIAGFSFAFVIIISFLSFIGYKSIASIEKEVSRNNVESKAEELIDKLKQKEELLDEMIANLGKKIQSINKLENIPNETSEDLTEFDNMLGQTKLERDYTSEDWYLKGVNEYYKENHPAVITFMSKAIELGVETVGTYLIRASGYGKLGQYENAVEDYSEAIKLEPGNLTAFNNRGIMFLKLNQYQRAVEDLNKVIELDPSNVSAYILRGNAYSNLKQYDKAIENSNKVIELDPENVSAINTISEYTIITGNYKRALDSINKGLSLQLKTRDRAILLYLECIAKKLLNMDTSDSEAAFNEILEKDFTIYWSFEVFESWLEDSNIGEDTKRLIREKTNRLEKHL